MSRAELLRATLEELVKVRRSAHYMLEPAGGHSGTRRAPASKPPLKIEALDIDCGHSILTVLEGFEVLWRRVFGLTAYGEVSATRTGDPVEEVVEFLSAWADEAEAEEGCEFPLLLRTSRALLGAAQHDLGLVEDHGWAECPCGGRIRVEDGVRCRACGTEWNLARLLAVAEGPVWVNYPVASWLLGDRLGPLVRDGAVRRRGSGPFAMYDLNPPDA